MSKVIRVSDRFASSLEKIRREYSDSLGRPVKMTRITDGIHERLSEEGFLSLWLDDAKKRRRKK